MTTIALVGIDLGKRSFHIHAQDTGGREVLRRQMSRVQLVRWLAQLPPCTVAFEGCCGAHWLGWKLRELGHTPRMIDPRRVRPFVSGNKHDFADAQAICEAACRPTIRSIEPKTPEQLALASLHRIRDARVAERTACINQTHAFLLEFGMSMAGSKAMMSALPEITEERAICELNVEGPPLAQLPPEQLWQIGPFEMRLARLQQAYGGNGARVALRSLFALPATTPEPGP